MTRTKSMIYKETAESRELELYAEHTACVYRNYMAVVENLNRKTSRGVYDREKAVDAFYHVAQYAAQRYADEFDDVRNWFKMFSVADRFTVAVNMRDMYELEYQTRPAEVVDFPNNEETVA